MKLFGIIGNPVTHSFSPNYFNEKFHKIGLSQYHYNRYKLSDVNQFDELIQSNPSLVGLNVTHPFKSKILTKLDSLDPTAKHLGAANTICFDKNGKSKGYNTDVIGFDKTLRRLNVGKVKALVLGTGGVAKAVEYVLLKHQIDFMSVSRNPSLGQILYRDVTTKIIFERKLIINCTPLGMRQLPDEKPQLPYSNLNNKHILIDLIYNPKVTPFLNEGLKHGCRVKNGFEMLIEQAEASWKLWQSYINKF